MRIRSETASVTHMKYLDLPLHGDAEECYEVHDEYWPEDRHVEKLEEGAEEGDDGGLGGRVPKLKLRKTPYKRAELLVLPGGKLRTICTINTFMNTSSGSVGLRNYSGDGRERI